MNQYGSWKRTEEAEIDLADLLKRICMEWKQALACALVFAVILGGYGYWKAEQAEQAGLASAENTAVLDDIELTKEEQQKVTDAIQLEKEIKGLEEYLENSILMQADPYHKNKVVMLYSISQAKGEELQRIAECYLNFIVNGGASDALKKSENRDWDMDKSYLNEAVSAYQREARVPYQIVMEYGVHRDMTAETFLYIEVTGKDARMAERLAEDMQSVIKTYKTAAEEVGKHKLSLLSSVTNVVADSSLQNQQRDKRSQLSASLTNLKTMTDAFSEEQMAVYRSEGDAGDGQKEDGEAIAAESPSINIKYIFLGLTGGMFLYCCVFTCWYLFRGTVKNTEEMKERYTFPVYGNIHLKKEAGRKKEKLSGREKDIYEREKARVLNRIRLACKNQGITRLCAASEFTFGEKERECMKSIAAQFKDWGIDTIIIENASADTAMWDMIADMGNVLLICKTDVTTYRMIDEAMSFYMENTIAVVGAVAFT